MLAGTVHPDPIDTHVHIFERGLSLAPNRRYAPAYDAHAHALMDDMQGTSVRRAILVQPSFLGTDNSFILNAIQDAPNVFRGVAVVDPHVSDAELANLVAGGIVGVRINCIGQSPPDLSSAAFHAFAERLASLRAVLEVQAEGSQWQMVAPSLTTLPCAVLIDHFGRTDGCEGGALDLLLDASAKNERVFFKFSAPYRLPPPAASLSAARILATVGPGRVIWGSDWPWTGHEGGFSYADTLRWLAAWVPDDQERRALLCGNPGRLFALDWHD
ncbi:amidohydrolase family protein [Sphingomonas bacterium]|uniref:amidohydrolase family protein n=1 Tax=Sphingomonas bacterium TaxID=1895847 RepID=UPI001576988C|nr:amidohydrolase family protein [Sphingomonas bacterium]